MWREQQLRFLVDAAMAKWYVPVFCQFLVNSAAEHCRIQSGECLTDMFLTFLYWYMQLQNMDMYSKPFQTDQRKACFQNEQVVK